MKQALSENLVKNIILILILIPCYFWIKDSFQLNQLAIDKSLVGSFLIAVSMFSVIACFGNFAFTYEKAKLRNYLERLLAHLITGLFMLAIGLSLEMTSILVGLLIDIIPIFNFSLILIYIASVLYDFWDLKRIE